MDVSVGIDQLPIYVLIVATPICSPMFTVAWMASMMSGYLNFYGLSYACVLTYVEDGCEYSKLRTVYEQQ